jgi:hypothetical protein
MGAIGMGVLLMSLTFAGSAFAAPPATNDNFADAKNIGSGALPYVNEVDASAATLETNEPDADRCSANTDDNSIWYSITPNFRGALRADTIGTDGGDITVYTGSNLTNLNEIACNDSLSDDSSSARVTFKVNAGTKYYIRVTDGDEHTVFHLRRAKRPANDDFSDARQLTVGALPLRERVSILSATYQYAEPNSEDIGTDGCSTVDPSIWYTIRPTSTTNLRVTIESGIDTVVAVYRGDSLGSLVPIGCNDDTSVEGQGLGSNVAWRAFAGVRYYIQVGGYYGQTNSRVSVVIAKGKPPANDMFANATSITANGALHHTFTQDATMELAQNEPDPAACSLANTVWYKFTAPATGDYLLDTFGTEFDSGEAVYTGNSLGSLSTVGYDCGGSAPLMFSATMGTTYRIQIGGQSGDSGDLHVHLNPVP